MCDNGAGRPLCEYGGLSPRLSSRSSCACLGYRWADAIDEKEVASFASNGLDRSPLGGAEDGSPPSTRIEVTSETWLTGFHSSLAQDLRQSPSMVTPLSTVDEEGDQTGPMSCSLTRTLDLDLQKATLGNNRDCERAKKDTEPKSTTIAVAEGILSVEETADVENHLDVSIKPNL